MTDDENIIPDVHPFKDGRKGQSSYAAMLGSVFLYFIGGDRPPPKAGWDRWKALFYLQANAAGLTDIEASAFLNQTCLILVALGIIDPPDEILHAVSREKKKQETIH